MQSTPWIGYVEKDGYLCFVRDEKLVKVKSDLYSTGVLLQDGSVFYNPQSSTTAQIYNPECGAEITNDTLTAS